jgi:hypothetical protein
MPTPVTPCCRIRLDAVARRLSDSYEELVAAR